MRPDLNSTVADRAAAMRRPHSRLLGLGLVIALAGLLAAPTAHATERIYWSNHASNSIAWADTNDDGGGGTVNTTGATVDGPMGMTIDPSRGLIYWANWGNDNGTTISYAHLDGSGGGDLAITGATVDAPHGLAIDPDAGPYGTIYWPNHASNTIGWATLDGAGGGAGGDFAITNATIDEPRGMMIDPLTDRLYWSNFAAAIGMTISYVDLDGAGDGDLLNIGLPGEDPEGPEGTAVDPQTRKIYWSDFGQKHLIQFADIDGTGVSILDTTGATTKGVHGVAIDPDSQRIYWANWFSDGIGYANLDGSGGGDLDVSGAGMPVGSNPNLPVILKAPAGTAAPEISGGSDPGATLSCSSGSWAGDVLESLFYRAPESLAYQWTRNGNDLPGAESDSITADTEGDYRCRVTAANTAGATSQTSPAHAIDITPPNTTIDSGPSGTTSDNDPSFTFSSEAGASFECRLDGPGAVSGAFTACASPKHYSGLADGDYTFRVRATDQASNTDGTPATRSFTVDTTPPPVIKPKTTITRQPKSTIKTRKRSVRVRVAFRSEPGATFECKLDRADYESCSSPYRVKVRAKTKRRGVRPKQDRISVEAISGVGVVGRPAVVKFKVIRRR